MRKKIESFIADPSDPKIQTGIWNLLLDIDQEFVPTLSSRGSTTAMALNTDKPRPTNLLNDYFADITRQVVLMVKVEAELAGFLSFKPGYQIDFLPEYSPCNYITTVGISTRHRNMGAGRALYAYLFSELPQHLTGCCWVTRTWSHNDSHLRLLRVAGFELVKTLVDHRGPGVHTVYYAYRTSQIQPWDHRFSTSLDGSPIS